MTVQRLYRCNLCSYDATHGSGIVWLTTEDGEQITLTEVSKSEHHLCGKCIVQLADTLTRHLRRKTG
jgi:hypothetical protein